MNCSGDLKYFANSRPSASNFKSFSRSLEQFFLTVGQNNFGSKIPFPFRSILAGSESKDDRVIAVETQLELATAKASEAENLWQDFERKLNLAEQELYRTSEKALISEAKIKELESELNEERVRIKSLESKEASATTEGETLSEKLKTLQDKNECSELRAEHAEREVAKLRLQVDQLEEKLEKSMSIKTDKTEITEEMLKEIMDL